ncbi:MAG: AtpZ/AtpI family protein [Alphaproteobacteria bacterium]
MRARETQAREDRSGRANLSGSGVVLRVGIELVGTLAVGVAIGWGLDRWLGTGPWLLVVFFFLGAAAGVLNVYRAVSNIGLAPGYRPDGDAARDAGDEGTGGGTDEKR